MGTQDSLEDARDFVARYKPTYRMLWDRGFESWRQLGVRGQPAAVLVDRQGRELGRWIGMFDEDEVVSLVRSAG